ncbi:hypothetical protein VTJ04DRAFT_10086 [Mycothermus thermophilus]|uniref:uncharacterized protein n=1 Tax=Humicola insolens TaxID=85995 RepID=UPI0037436D48
MDPPTTKKRGLFSLGGLFRSSSTPAESRDKKTDASSKTTANLSLNANANAQAVAAPNSPVKRASSQQMASRKIIDRPQGPSSRLTQSFSVSEIPHRPSNALSGPPRRMPGDNPYKNAPALSAPSTSQAPHSNLPKSTSFSGVPTTSSRNIFRSSALYQKHGGSSFAPRVNDTLNQSFPPATPGRPARGGTPDVNGRILANTGPTELFNMKIASPPRHLTGEMMAREVPHDPNRTGSIYADEFLSHYCPPEFDDLQRRQFFCILDLRRLKYAADEVFTKKDWKINITNFAKEYEKSRSLIMLRYGLYEFKTVRPSEAVKKEWKLKHNIPDSDDEGETAKVNGTGKRKAEDELGPATTSFASTVASPNKRRAPESPARTKRKADDEPEENQPAKLQKPGPAMSATRSFLERVANSQSTATAAKSTTKPTSLFDTATKPAPTTNIFGHLSDGSKSSGKDEVSETSADEDESEAEGAGEGEGDEGTGSASQLANGTSSASSDAGSQSQGRSLFDRITRGSDGQPVRKVPPGTDLFAPPAPSRSVSPAKEQPPAPAPANKTWTAGTPIKFAPTTSSPLFGAKPATTSTIDFGAKPETKTSTVASKETPASNLFGAQPKKADEPATTNGAKPNLFSTAPTKPAEAPATTTSLFGTSTTPAPTSNLFGSATPAAPLFGQSKESEKKDSSSTPATTTSLFGVKPATTTTEPPKTNLFQFGQTKTDAAPAGGLFGQAASTETKTDKPATSLFSTEPPKTTNLFGAATTPAASGSEEPAAKKVAFGGDAKPAGSLFGATTTPAPAATETKSLFGATTTPAPTTNLFGSTTTSAPSETKSLFGTTTTPAASTTETKSLFGTTTAPTETKNLFGATTPAASGAETKSLFGTNTSTSTEVKPLFGTTPASTDPKPLFGATTTTESKPLFGATTTTESKPLFGAAPESKPLFGSTTTEAKPLFGNTATESKPLFGAAPATDNKPAGLFGNTTTAAPVSTSIFNFGASTAAPATSQPATSGSIFGSGGSASFTFSAGGTDGTIKNPFASGTYSAPSSFNFGSDAPSSTTPFTFGAGAGPTISFGSNTDSSTQQPTTGSIFNFGANTSTPPVFGSNPPTAAPIFGSSLAPGGGTSTGTNSPFTFGGASSLATTPAASTPEPSGTAAAAAAQEGQGTDADGDDAPQEQISLTDGGPGEEEEHAVFEVRAKAVKLVPGGAAGGDSEDDSGSSKEAKSAAKSKSPWVVQGVGPLRLLKHKTTGSVRMLLRAEPRGNVAMNKLVLPDFTYKAEAKYVKIAAAKDDGKGLETWMLQVKTPESAKELAAALEEHKVANKKEGKEKETEEKKDKE